MAGSLIEGQSPKGRLQKFIDNAKVGKAARYRELTVSARVTYETPAVGKKDKAHTEAVDVPLQVLYTQRFPLPRRTVLEQTVPYDSGHTQNIGSKIEVTALLPRIRSRVRLRRRADKLLKQDPSLIAERPDVRESVPKGAQIRSVDVVAGDPKKVTVVKLDPSPEAPGDASHNTNVRVIVDTARWFRSRADRRVKVVVLSTDSSKYLDRGVRTEEAVVRTTTLKSSMRHLGAWRARTFVDMMLRHITSHTFDVQQKPGNWQEEHNRKKARWTISLQNTPTEEA